ITMSTHRTDRRVTAGLAIGTVAIALAVVATVVQSRPAESSHASSTTSSAPAPTALPPRGIAMGAASGAAAAPANDLAGVTFDSDGVLRIDGHVVVNKSFALPATFGPGDLDPALVAAFQAMQAEAAASGFSLWILSGYRSHAHQTDNYTQRVAEVGQETADRGMARPGHSEHQTGLAIDVNSLSTSFGATPTGQWVAQNAYRFGFVVRYPDGKEAVTGFKYEPWHLRYLGVELATELTASGLTLEERYGLPSAY
ncbi:MAG: D-alanyl-D-alanine carboxypeptidase family protein, partial [Actinomycetales bacterium]